MLKNDEVETVKSLVTMKQIAGMYGYTVSRSGFIRCPFHGDTTPSMKVYDGRRGYYCFVCHQGGDVIDFVMKHDGIEFEPAVRLIADHFRIPLSDGDRKLSQGDLEKIARQKAERKAAEKERKANQDRLLETSKRLHYLKDAQAKFDPLGPVWCWLQNKIESAEKEWDELFNKEVG